MFITILCLPLTVFGEEKNFENSDMYLNQKTEIIFFNKKYFSIGLKERCSLLKNEKKPDYNKFCEAHYRFYGTFKTMRNNLKNLTKIDIQTESFRGNLTLFYPGAKLYLDKDGVFDLKFNHLGFEFSVSFPLL